MNYLQFYKYLLQLNFKAQKIKIVGCYVVISLMLIVWTFMHLSLYVSSNNYPFMFTNKGLQLHPEVAAQTLGMLSLQTQAYDSILKWQNKFGACYAYKHRLTTPSSSDKTKPGHVMFTNTSLQLHPQVTKQTRGMLCLQTQAYDSILKWQNKAGACYVYKHRLTTPSSSGSTNPGSELYVYIRLKMFYLESVYKQIQH